MVNLYIPEKGDLVWINFNPNLGHEQQGRRPALVLSPKKYNEKTNLGIFLPITSARKNYPFEIILKTNSIEGVILSDQIKCLDWSVRNTEFIEKAPESVVWACVEKSSHLIG